ncbi:MAG: hypothetical protein ACK4QW_00950 [Alphaproteobacteria bacterium]
MRVVRSLLLYAMATGLVLVAVPSAVVGWYTASPATFGSAVHAAVNLLDTGSIARPAPAVIAVAATAAELEPPVAAGDEAGDVPVERFAQIASAERLAQIASAD